MPTPSRPRALAATRRAALTLALALSLPALAQTAAPAQAPARADTLAKISASRSITLGVRRDAAPFSYLDSAGRPAGFSWNLCLAVVHNLSQALGVPLTVKFMPVSLEESFKQLNAGQIDLHCGVTAHTSARAQQVAFSDTFFLSQVVAAHRASDKKYESTREFGRTGVLQGSTAQQLMQTYAQTKAHSHHLGPITAVASYAEGVKLLREGAIDTLVADEPMLPQAADIAIRRSDPLTLEPYALVMRKNDAAFAAAVDKALRPVLASPQAQRLADQAGLKVPSLTKEAWRRPHKLPAPPVL